MATYLLQRRFHPSSRPQLHTSSTMSHALSHTELHNLEITERVASCFSLVGTSFIFFTFLYSPAFRKPVNRLIFYASWGYALCLLDPLTLTAIHEVVRYRLTPRLGLTLRAFPPTRSILIPMSGRNSLCNVATLMSQSGVRAGRDSHLCQFQGFLIQM